MQKIKISLKKSVTIPKINNKQLQNFSFYGKIKPHTFYIGKYEVTKEEYNEYLKANHQKPIIFNYEDEKYEPIANVDFNTAKKVCEFYKGRLPTNKEWIIAASIKTAKSRCYEYLKPYSFSNFPITKKAIECFKKYDNEFEESLLGKELLDVNDSYENINGTYGMYGNVFEWVDNEVKYFTTSYKIIKGGSYASDKIFFDVRINSFAKKETKQDNIGFRCAWDVK